MSLETKITKQTVLPYVKYLGQLNAGSYRTTAKPSNREYLFHGQTGQTCWYVDDYKYFASNPAKFEVYLADGPMTNITYSSIKENLKETLSWAEENNISKK
jgi:hypothetical protein